MVENIRVKKRVPYHASPPCQMVVAACQAASVSAAGDLLRLKDVVGCRRQRGTAHSVLFPEGDDYKR